MNMSAISEYYTADEAAIKALKAGADMILMPEDFVTAYEGVIAAVKDGTIDEDVYKRQTGGHEAGFRYGKPVRDRI